MVMASTARRPSRRSQARRHRIRRWTAALLAGLAAFAAVSALGPRGSVAAGVPTLVAARDVPAGSALSRADLVLADRPSDQRPQTALAAYEGAVGRVAAVPISTNDAITPERLAGADLLRGQPPGHVAVTLPTTGVEGLGLSPGDRVDVYATGTGTLVAADGVVLVARAADDDALGGATGASVTVALPPRSVTLVAASLSALETGGKFIIALRRA